MGVFGASLAYSTIFSATRGRLDFVAYAFTSFILLLVPCALLPTHPDPVCAHHRTSDSNRSFITGRTFRALNAALLYFFAFAGVVLLSLSMFLTSDFDAPAVTKPSRVINQAGWFPISTAISWILIAIPDKRARLRYIFRRAPRYTYPTETDWPQPRDAPSHIVVSSWRLRLLPGGDEYPRYRKERLRRANVSRYT